MQITNDFLRFIIAMLLILGSLGVGWYAFMVIWIGLLPWGGWPITVIGAGILCLAGFMAYAGWKIGTKNLKKD